MLQNITQKVNYSYQQLAAFINEEDLKTEAVFSLVVTLFLIIILYA